MSKRDPDVRLRPAARVLVLNPEDQLLLFDVRLNHTRAWVAPGGGLEPGETYEEAARRELEEETGIRAMALSPCLWTLAFRFRYNGIMYNQRERYFLAKVNSHIVSTKHWTRSEAREIQRVRWWSLEQLMTSTADFRPATLATLLPPILAGDYPKQPIPAPAERSLRPA